MKRTHLSLLAAFLTTASVAPAAEIANSINDFTTDGTQGAAGWTYGYRNYTVDGGGDDYDANADFIAFDSVTEWDGTKFDFPANPPWTEISAAGGHPNGTNNVDEHWCIRRWTADATQPIAVTWMLAEQNNGGSGVGGSLHVNGTLVDAGATDTLEGFTRTYYINIEDGDLLDLTLTPVGPSGDRGDGADGSLFSMVIDDEVDDIEMQPDGSIFIASDAVDSDGDNLPDGWEEVYFPGNLAALNGDGVADNEGDGLSDFDELFAGTDPTENDSDGDDLDDGEEVDDHGTDPAVADTDGDGRSDGDEVNGTPTSDPTLVDTDGDTFGDGEEVDVGSDPNDINDTPLSALLGNSEAEWSGVQDQDDWSYGYRNVTQDGAGPDSYNGSAHFIAFAGGEAGGAWDGTTQQWSGTAWDLNTAGAAPWTVLQQTGTHPNGSNNGDEHWSIRRWTAAAPEIPTTTPLAIHWHTRKGNANGNGVSGSIHHNGELIDRAALEGADQVGVFRTVYVNVNPGDTLDIAHTPIGANGDTADGSDFSHNWMRVDSRIPANPVQPDGMPFVPATGEDTDADGLPDAWEEGFFPEDPDPLSHLASGGDFDMDGLDDEEEFTGGTDPTDDDSDDDTLLDGAEVNTHGTNPNAADTDSDGRSDSDELDGGAEGVMTDPTDPDSDDDGINDGPELDQHDTDPNEADTDDDGDLDGYEVDRCFDPLDPTVNSGSLLADSFEDFSQTQGQANWNWGYRNLTADGGALESYDPGNDFIAFDEATEWRPNWRLVPNAAPWTFVAEEGIHPNGTNSAPNEEHWPIRRWVANDLAGVTPLGLTWHTRETNLAGTGVTGRLFVNGQQVDGALISGGDGVGVKRTYYANVNPGDIIDLALTPVGDGDDPSDGSDGSANWLRVDTFIPPGAMQPDGTPFVPAGGGGFAITAIEYTPGTGTMTITFPSVPGRFYAVEATTTMDNDVLLGGWSEVEDFEGTGGDQQVVVSIDEPLPPAFFVRIVDLTDK